MRLIYVAPLALAAGCAIDDPTDDPETAQTEQAVTSTALNGWTCSNQPYCNFDLGPSANRACFLAGIRGAAAAGPGSLSGIWIDGTTNDYVLTIYPPAGNPITVTTACVTPGAHKATAHWEIGPLWPAQLQIPNTTSATRCFLSQVAAEGGGMTHYNDSVKTWKDRAGTWWLGGTTQTGYVDGNAICFDATDVGDWSWGQGVPGSITGNLNANTGGVACGLTEIGGVFTTNAPTDGVFIDYVARAQQWIWTLVNYKHGYATCIK